MSLGQISVPPKSVQLAWRFGVAAPQNLSLILESKARSLRDTAALLLPYPDSKANGSNFVSIDFRDLVMEQNAWVNYLVNRGVRKGDATVVWLPYGSSFISITYALFKIGAHAIALDPEYDWKVGYAKLKELEPLHMIGVRGVLSYAKSMENGRGGTVNRIEVENPQGFVRSALRSFQTRSVIWQGEDARLTLMRTLGGRATSASYDHEQLFLLASCYRDWFGLSEGDRALPGSLLEALLFPAAGLASLVVSERLSDSSTLAAKLALQAAERFGLQLVSGDARFWRGVAKLARQGILSPTARFEAVVHCGEAGDCEVDTLREALPKVGMNLLFGSPCNPFVASRRWGDEPQSRGSETFRGVYRGKPLPGLQVSLLPSEDLRWPEEPRAATPVGVIATAKQDYAPVGDPDCWTGTGELGFFDFHGGLWHCGSRDEVIATSFGGFCPARCEALFNHHPRVKRSALIALRKNGKTRPGLVVETAVGDIPKRGVEESRFRAELLQLAMDVEETSLIVDIFFSDRLPLDDGGFGTLDRNRLSKEYSRRLRY